MNRNLMEWLDCHESFISSLCGSVHRCVNNTNGPFDVTYLTGILSYFSEWFPLQGIGIPLLKQHIVLSVHNKRKLGFCSRLTNGTLLTITLLHCYTRYDNATLISGVYRIAETFNRIVCHIISTLVFIYYRLYCTLVTFFFTLFTSEKMVAPVV